MARCALKNALGEIETCAEARCAFWEPGGAVLAGRCAVEEVAFAATPELAAWLLEIRALLDSAQTREQREEAHRLFAHALNQGRGD